MRSVYSLGLIALLAACSEPDAEASNDVAANAPVDIEAVPADESSVTTDEELENGANESADTNVDNQL